MKRQATTKSRKTKPKPRKITGWSLHRIFRGIHTLVTVQAKTKREAIKLLEAAGEPVQFPSEIKHSVTVSSKCFKQDVRRQYQELVLSEITD